jgi:hypothetical protein
VGGLFESDKGHHVKLKSMLIKNVYIVFPPGYSGSYLDWAIQCTDLDLANTIVQDPINQSDSLQFGGVGTAHKHTKIPTHQNFVYHTNWLVYNRPTTPHIYSINCSSNPEQDIAQIINYDPTGIIIRIHDNNDDYIASYGFINCITKWPTFLLANSEPVRPVHLEFDPFNCSSDRAARNQLLSFAFTSPRLNYSLIETHVTRYKDWYEHRNTYNPHEVNEKTYVTNHSLENRIFELSCLDIASMDFLNILENIMIKSQISDNVNLDYIKHFHHNYVDAQVNLEWFSSIYNWKQTGNLNNYITSHSVIEACLIKHIFKNLNIDPSIDINSQWRTDYENYKDPMWPSCPNEWDFNSLPKLIQTEIINALNYTPKSAIELIILELQISWRSKSIQEINSIYQQLKTHPK